MSLQRAAFAPLIFVAFVPLLAAGAAQSPRAAFCGGAVSGVVAHFLALGWMPTAIADLQGGRPVVALVAFCVFAAYGALQFAIYASGMAFFSRTSLVPSVGQRKHHASAPHSIVWLGACAGLWVVLEVIFPKPIPWSLGDVLAEYAVLRQAAALGGVHLLGALVVLVNLAAATLWLGAGLRRARVLAGLCVILGGAAAYGSVGPPVADQAGQQVRVALVQGSDRTAARTVGYTRASWMTYAQLTRRMVKTELDTDLQSGGARASAHPEVDLIVWPETILPVYLDRSPPLQAELRDLSSAMRASLLVGAFAMSPLGGSFNAAYLFEPRGHAASGSPGRVSRWPLQGPTYRKRRLMPFGEYLPGRRFLDWYPAWATSGHFKPAPRSDGPVQMSVGSGGEEGSVASFATSICYEAILPGFFNTAVAEGAEFLLNLSSDALVGSPIAAYQSLRAARIRAIETRRWLIRVSSTGPSAVIDPNGHVREQLGYDEVGVVLASIETRRGASPYVRLGEWPVALAWVAVAYGFSIGVLDDRPSPWGVRRAERRTELVEDV